MADGSRIRELRTRRGLLQRELAEMAGVTESAVRNYELGLRTPRPQHLEALARALGVACVWSSPSFGNDHEEFSGLGTQLFRVRSRARR